MLVYFYMPVGWKFPENGIKKIEKFQSFSGLYMKVYVLIRVCLLVLSINLFISERIWILLKAVYYLYVV